MLAGVCVLEICDGPGALAGRILVELGADVVRIDEVAAAGDARPALRPGADPEHELVCHGGKRSLTLDCERPEGRAVLSRLLERADVLLDDAMPGTLERWGLGAEALSLRHPRLVRCAITPFGQTGPYASHRGGEGVLAALAGVDLETADAGVPLRAAELAAHEAVLGVLLALWARESGSTGHFVDVSLHESRRSAHAHAGDARGPLGSAVARRPAPRAGEHSGDVLREAGFGEAEIARMAAEGVI